MVGGTKGVCSCNQRSGFYLQLEWLHVRYPKVITILFYNPCILIYFLVNSWSPTLFSHVAPAVPVVSHLTPPGPVQSPLPLHGVGITGGVQERGDWHVAMEPIERVNWGNICFLYVQ